MEPSHGPPGQQSDRRLIPPIVPAINDAIRELIYRSCCCLDEHDFDGYLALCAPGFRYQTTLFSPELRKEMIWLNHDRDGLKALLDMVPRHLVRLGALQRNATVYTIKRDAADGQADVMSAFSVFNIDNEGRPSVFAVGHYHDTVDLTGAQPLLARRNARLASRDLGIGSRIPI
jgi:methanesulfonate monooxygenase small subunit